MPNLSNFSLRNVLFYLDLIARQGRSFVKAIEYGWILTSQEVTFIISSSVAVGEGR